MKKLLSVLLMLVFAASVVCADKAYSLRAVNEKGQPQMRPIDLNVWSRGGDQGQGQLIILTNDYQYRATLKQVLRYDFYYDNSNYVWYDVDYSISYKSCNGKIIRQTGTTTYGAYWDGNEYFWMNDIGSLRVKNFAPR